VLQSMPTAPVAHLSSEIPFESADDRGWFHRHPDREYRCRRATRDAISGHIPTGKEAFCILHRQDVGEYWEWKYFGAPITFETDIPDREIRRALLALSSNRHAYLI